METEPRTVYYGLRKTRLREETISRYILGLLMLIYVRIKSLVK